MTEDATFLPRGPIVRAPLLPDLVSERLAAAISEARLPPGSKLPSERDLGEQLGVSRTVVREAIRHLAAKGLLNIQSGSGVRVAHVQSAIVSESLALFLRRKGPLDAGKLHEVRETLEIAAVRLATERATDAQMKEIRRVYDTLGEVAGDTEAAALADVEFHRAVATATNNELFVVLIDSVGDVLLEMRLATMGQPGRVDAAQIQHGRVVEAMESRDVEAAAKAMEEHLVDSILAFRSATEK